MSLLDQPEVQSAVAPWLVGLLSGLVLFKWAPRYWGLALVAGFVCTALLVNGLGFVPLTGTRKIIIVIVLAAVIGAAMESLTTKTTIKRLILSALALLAYAWVGYRVLANQPGLLVWLYSIGGIVYLSWLVLMLEVFRTNTHATLGVAIALGTGTSIVSILGASALLGQLAAGLAAGAGALWLIVWRRPNAQFGSETSFPLAVGAALLGMGGVLFARLPWYGLLILAVVPAVYFLPRVRAWASWRRSFAYLLAAMTVAGAAVLTVWLTMEDTAGVY